MNKQETCRGNELSLKVSESGPVNPGGFTVVFEGCANLYCPMKNFKGTNMEYPGGDRTEESVHTEAADAIRNMCSYRTIDSISLN